MSAGIYVHVPFCITRCGYCDFNAYTGLEGLMSRYERALVREAELSAQDWDAEGVDSVFFGGGTPTTLDATNLAGLLERLRELYRVAPAAEITIEANPDTVDVAKLAHLREAGFDRLSMGVQSFDLAVLASLERIHDPDSVREAFEAARAGGYRSWEQTLAEAVGLEPEHISAYALTIEASTPLGRKVATGAVPSPDPDAQADMFQAACEILRAAGYRHYEVSNWAKQGFECRHNLGYWERRPYLGLGAGAHSFREDRRWWNVRPPEQYVALLEADALPVGGDERLGAADSLFEEFFLRMRILKGIPVRWVEPGRAQAFLDSGLLALDRQALVPTERGMLLLNELVLALTG